MRWAMVFVTAVVALLFGIVPPASADFSVTYPDGTLGIEINLGLLGAHVAVFWDMPGDFDIFTFHANPAGIPLLISAGGGLPAGVAYWLNFLGRDALGRLVYNVFVSQGGGFFSVTTIAF